MLCKLRSSLLMLGLSSLAINLPAQAEEIEIQFWHSMTGHKGKLVSEIANDFNQAHRGSIRVLPQFVGTYTEGLNKLRTALIAGRPPQVMQVTDIGTALMVDSDAVIPLQSLAEKDPSFPMTEILPTIRGYYEVRGKLFSLPFATSNPILYYNIDLFTKAGLSHPPRTFAEMEEMATRLTNKQKKIYGATWPLESWFVEEFLAKQGAVLLLPENGRGGVMARESNLLAPEAQNFLALWKRMVKNGSFINTGRGWDPAQQNFLAGRAAMLITSTSDVFEILRTAPFKLGTAPLPSASEGPCGEKCGGTIIGGNSLWIMKAKSRAQELASYEFLKFMASAEIQRRWHARTGYFPIRKDVLESLKAEGFYEKYAVAWTAIEQMRSSPAAAATQGALTTAFPELRENVMTAIEEILSDTSDIPVALEKAKKRTDFTLLREAKYAEQP